MHEIKKADRIRRLLFLFLVCVTAFACMTACAEKFSIRASMTMEDTHVTVSSRYVNNKYTLFIPGNWELSRVYIEMTGSERIRVGDTEIVSGQVNDLTGCLGQKQKYYNAKGGRQSGTLSILYGSAVSSLHLEVDAGELKKANKDKHYIIDQGTAVYVEADGKISYAGGIESLKGRGNSTFAYSKKPYQLKLAAKADLSGMGKDKTWLLIANWLDLSLLRNQIIMQLACQVGMPYAVESRMVDVYLNGEYNGLYLMTEKIQIGKSRVRIRDLEESTETVNSVDVSTVSAFKETDTEGLLMLRGYEIPEDPEDITGGYILEIEKSYRFRDKIDNGFRTADGLSVTVKEPTCASRAQVTYIGRLVSDFHRAVLAEDGISPDTGKYYAEYIDMDSWALKWWMEEISKNYDAMASSQFFFKDSDSVDSRLFAGPCWDYDLSFGNMHAQNFMIGTMPARDYVAVYSTKKTNIYRALYLHEDFRQKLSDMYRTRVRPALGILLGETEAQTGDNLRSFDRYAADIDASALMNFTRWPESLVSGYYTKSGTTHARSADFLKNFLVKRVEYLDSVWLQ